VSDLTIHELAKARPKPSHGRPARTRSHYDAILALLRERGDLGVRSSELYSRPEMYGRSPRNRISEARRAGHLIEGKPFGSSDWFYRLIRDSAGEGPAGAADWYKRKHGPRPAGEVSELPLFSGAR
jgi:hypothetical protein